MLMGVLLRSMVGCLESFASFGRFGQVDGGTLG